MNKLGKVPGLGNVAEKAKLLKSLTDCLRKIGTETIDIGKELVTLGTAIGQAATSGSIDNITEVKASSEKLQESKQNFQDEIAKAKSIIEQLKALEGDDKSGKQGKISRIIDAVLRLVENAAGIVENIDVLLEKLKPLLENEVGGAGEIKVVAKDVLSVLEELKESMVQIKDDVNEIKDIITGSDGGGGGGEDKEKSKKEKVEKSDKPDKSDKRDKSGKPEVKVVEVDEEDGDGNKSCWQGFKSCFCWCC